MSRESVAVTALTPAVWGSTYLVTTELLPPERPLLAATARALPVGIVFLLWTRTLPTGAWWWRTFVLGTLNIGAFFALLFVAAFRLPGGVAATAGALQPLVAAALGVVLLGEAFTRRVGLAGLAGVLGVAMLVLGPDAALDLIGVAAAVAGTLSMAAGVVLTKKWGRPVGLVAFTGWQLTAGGLVLLPLLLLVEGAPPDVTGVNIAGFFWLAAIGTGLAYANWFRGIQRLPVTVVSFLALLSPLVATLLGWVVLGETLSPLQLTGAGLVVSAVIAPQLGMASAPMRRENAEQGEQAPGFVGAGRGDGSTVVGGSHGGTGEDQGDPGELNHSETVAHQGPSGAHRHGELQAADHRSRSLA